VRPLPAIFFICCLPVSAHSGNWPCQKFENASGAEIIAHRAANPLHYAAFEGDLKSIRALATSGANISERDECGFTPMAVALSSRPNGIANIDAIKTLVAHGADINELGMKGESVLCLAITSIGSFTEHAMPEGWGRPTADNRLREFVAWAIDNKANVNATEPVSQATPLHFAVSRNEKTLVALLIKAGADVNARTKNNATPLSVAVRHNYQEVINLLRQSGAKP